MSVLSRRTNEQIKKAEITLIIHEQSFYTIAKKKQRKRLKQVSGHIQGQSHKRLREFFQRQVMHLWPQWDLITTTMIDFPALKWLWLTMEWKVYISTSTDDSRPLAGLIYIETLKKKLIFNSHSGRMWWLLYDWGYLCEMVSTSRWCHISSFVLGCQCSNPIWCVWK